METKNKYKGYFRTFLNIAAGAGAVIGGAYILSRIKEKQDTEIRLERMEQIIETMSSPEELKGKE
jgi:Na+/H+ antiporter NhaC